MFAPEQMTHGAREHFPDAHIADPPVTITENPAAPVDILFTTALRSFIFARQLEKTSSQIHGVFTSLVDIMRRHKSPVCSCGR
jgi:hypothetical protein